MIGSRRRRRLRPAACALAVCAAGALGSAPGVRADFPYLPKSGGDPHNVLTWRLAPGETPSNFGDDWRFAATPEQSAASDTLVNPKSEELCGVRGASVVDANALFPPLTGSCIPAGTPVKTAFEQTLGRPDVVIAVLDSGIEWNNAGAMVALRDKVWLNQGELPAPRHDLGRSLGPGENCAAYRSATGGDYNPHGGYDVNDDGVFNVLDYACDSRVAAVVNGGNARHALRHGPPGVLTPEDLILAFSDGRDHDHNGFANDIAGWNFLDDNNDPFDDVQYGHGTGEAQDSNGEANTNQELGTCPDCMVMPLRVGESFIAGANRFAEAAVYATDENAYVIQEALGTLNESYFARQAIEYAYAHGTAVIGSAADEAAEHHNQPGALPDVIVVNSVTKYVPNLTSVPPSYLQLNGCTNFGTRVTLSVPSVSCSSEATGRGAGVAGLVYSGALNAIASGVLKPAADCRRVNGSPCPITANEVRQLMASGNIAGSTVPGGPSSSGSTPADAGEGGQADDVNFAAQPEPSCAPVALPTCTDPNLNTVFSPLVEGGVDAPVPDSRRYHARRGFDEFYGYGRLNAYKAVSAAAAGLIPPEADITSPDWFQQLDPSAGSIAVGGYVDARGTGYTCSLQVAPGAQPNNGTTTDTPPGDFAQASGGWCDGHTVRFSAFSGTVGTIDTVGLRARFPATLGSFTGNENGGGVQTSNGRPNTQPYAFTVRLVVSVAPAGSRPAMTGEDRRQLYLHRDADLVAGFPRELRTDGDSSPLLIDLAGDDRNQLVLATSDGQVHAFRSSGGELPGWPVHTNRLPLHLGEAAYRSVGSGHYCAVLGALAGGDLFHDGRIEIVADDNCGNVYAWDSSGRLVFEQHSDQAFSGAPLTPFHTVRTGPRDRTERGFLSSPVLGRLSGGPGSPLDIVVAGDDRHVYAWQPSLRRLGGTALPGFPVLVADPDKLASVDSVTGRPTFSATRASANPGIDEDQGKIIDTPAIALLNGKPEIVVGTNEEYAVNTGDEGPINAGGLTSASLGVLGATGLLPFANGRVYAIKATGGRMTCSGGRCHSSAFVAGWPKKVGIIDRGLLPDVGEGVDGSPVVAPVSCPDGGHGMKIGVTPDAGPSYLFNPNGTSCYGTDQSGRDNSLETDFSQGSTQYDHPAFSAVGYGAFGTLDGHTVDYFMPEAGLIRTLDVAVPDYQGGQDFMAGWNPVDGQQLPGFPGEVNDLQFLTGPAVGDIGTGAGQEVVGGSSSLDLFAFGPGGTPASPAWPKLTGDWIIATPTLGSFGSLDTTAGARKDVVTITRSGTLSVYSTPAGACSPSSSPRFHHDNWNSGDYLTDAIDPGKPLGASRRGNVVSFIAPGGDLMCGRATRYQLVTSASPITPPNFAAARPLSGAPVPGAAGAHQSFRFGSRAERYIAIRAVDEAGNVGLPAVLGTGRAGSGAPTSPGRGAAPSFTG